MIETLLNNPAIPQWLFIIIAIAALIYEGMSRRGKWKQDNAAAAVSEADADVKVSGAWREFADRLEKENETLRKRVGDVEERSKAHEAASKRNRERIQELESTVARHENERAVWDAERREWRKGIAIIIEQLRRLEIEPKWIPPDTGPLDK